MSNNRIIIGPPGTGKTTEGIKIVSDHIANGIRAEDICYVTFTRKGATEARNRVIEKLGLKPEQIPWFRTLHSLAFKYLNIDRKDVMTFVDYQNICKALNLTMSSQSIQEDGSFSIVHTKGDRLFFLENLSRSSKRTLQDVWQKYPNDDLLFAELELVSKALVIYKKARDKIDFTDMIEKFLWTTSIPNIRVLVVDEAQDLSPLQWDMVHRISTTCEYVYYAGDDDQAIYNWAGADALQFQNLLGKRTVLTKSYRLSNAVFKKANEIVKKINVRILKEFYPNENIGNVKQHSSIDTVDMSEGTWLLLARNIFLLTEYNDYCRSKGFIFESKYGTPMSMKAAKAIVSWETIRKGGHITGFDAKEMYEFLSIKTKVKWGKKKDLLNASDDDFLNLDMLVSLYGLQTIDVWFQALDKIPKDDVLYFRYALSKGESLITPRIKIDTIHGVKGGEADNVVLLTDMSKRTYDEMQLNMDDELRVWYTGITRAKNTVHLIAPKTAYYINI